MKQFIRRMTAVLLCALLALIAPLAAAQDMFAAHAQMTVTLEDGMQENVEATSVVTTFGDVVYWVDQSALDSEIAQMLPNGQLELVGEQGETLAVIPLSGNTVLTDVPAQLTDPATGTAYYVMIASTAAPQSPEEADAVLSAFGFAVPQQEEEPSEDWYEEPSEEWYEEPSEEWYEDPSEDWYEEPAQDWYEEPVQQWEPEPTDTPEPLPTATPEPVATDVPVIQLPVADPTWDEVETDEFDESYETGAAEQAGDMDPAPAGAAITAFPAYAMTLEQANGAVIVLRSEPAGDPPQGGAIPMIREPSPLELTGAEADATGQIWYYARNLSTGEEGYVEEFKIREVTVEEALAAVVTPEPTVVPPSTPIPVEEVPESTPAPTDTPEPTATPEPEEPQAMEAGDVYHYGYNTSAQVNVRQKADRNSKSLAKLEKGTVVWVMERTAGGEKDAWCHIRVNGIEGYMMAQYIQLMGVNEEVRYVASIDNPETPPVAQVPAEPTAAPDDGAQTIPMPGPTATPDYSIQNPIMPAPATDSPEPTATPVVEPTATPQPEATATPAPEAIDVYVRVSQNNTALRANASENANLQSMLKAEMVLHATQSLYGADGLWYLVETESGDWGYVQAASVAEMSEEETEDYLASLEAAKATPSPTPTLEPTPEVEATATPAPIELRLYARVLSDLTPLRGNPNANAYLQSILNTEDVVYIFQSQVAEDGMTWYLVQYASLWGYIRADLVRIMGEQETTEYLAALQAAEATATPMPSATPEPIGPDSTSAYAKLIRDSVNLRKTPSASGTSLGRIPVNTLLLVLGQEYDGDNTWYLVDYNGKSGYVRSDMAKLLTMAELREYWAEQRYTTPTPRPQIPSQGQSSGSGSSGSGSLADLIPVDDSWTNNVIDGMPVYATATPDPNATPTPQPPAIPATKIASNGTMDVSNVPAITETGTFSVYGKAAPYSIVTATVTTTISTTPTPVPVAVTLQLVRAALAESTQTVTSTVGRAAADANGNFTMDVKLPMPGEYIVEFASNDGSSYARYGVTYDTGVEPTAQPLPTIEPVAEENGGIGLLPIIGGVLLLVIAAAVYGVYVYRRRSEEEEDEEDELDEEEESELREEQLRAQRLRRESAPVPPTAPVAPTAPRMPSAPNAATPSYLRNQAGTSAQQSVSPYARPANAPVPPTIPVAPAAPTAPVVPAAPVEPTAPTAPVAPVAPVAPTAPEAPIAPAKPEQTDALKDEETAESATPRRRRRPPANPNA